MVPALISAMSIADHIIKRTVCTSALLPEALARTRARSPRFGRLTTNWPSGSPDAGRFSADMLLSSDIGGSSTESSGWDQQISKSGCGVSLEKLIIIISMLRMGLLTALCCRDLGFCSFTAWPVLLKIACRNP